MIYQYYKTAYWIENCRQIQNGGHYRPKSCNKTLKNDDVLHSQKGSVPKDIVYLQ